jgi:rubrerythrin
MLQQAVADDHRAKRMFAYALKAEAVHAKLYQMALEAVAQGKDLTTVDFYLCPVCGDIEIGKAPASCPICGTKGEKFVKV